MVTDPLSASVLVAVTAWQQILQLGPFVAGGVLLAALLGQLDWPRRWSILAVQQDQPAWCAAWRVPASILGAAGLGAVSPLSTFGALPILQQFLRGGTSPGPVLAFLVSSSLMNPQLFILVLGGLGQRLALAQLTGILVLSLLVGWAAAWLPPSLLLRPDARASAAPPNVYPRRFSWSALGGDMLRSSEWIVPAFVLGVILASALQVLVPADWVEGIAAQGRGPGALAAGILGVPLYTCGGSAVPVLVGLARLGFSPAAILAFLLSGQATRASSLAAMGSLLNRRALAAYVAYIVIGSSLLGLLLA